MTEPARPPMIRTARMGRGRARGGFALIIVLFLVMILAVTVAAFSLRTTGGYRLARSRAVSWRLYYASYAAAEEAKARLWHLAVDDPKSPGIFGPPPPAVTDENGVEVSITYVDEAGKFPVNAFASADDARQKDLVLDLARLFDALDLPASTSLATAVRDYIDKDTQGLRETGARNSAVYEMTELTAIPGFDMRTLYEPCREGLPPVAECMTTWYAGQVNINGASPAVIAALEPGLTDRDIKEIIKARSERPFNAGDDLAARAGLSADVLGKLGRKIGFTTDTLTLRVEARQGRFRRRMEFVVWVESSAAHTLFVRDGWQSQEVSLAGMPGH